MFSKPLPEKGAAIRLLIISIATIWLFACGAKSQQATPASTLFPPTLAVGQTAEPTMSPFALTPQTFKATLRPIEEVPTSKPTSLATSTIQLTQIPRPSPTYAPETTADPYETYTISTLSERTYGGGQLEIVETLASNDVFTRYLISYPSDGLTIYGYLDVPIEGDHFPVVIALHGYISPEQYQTITYTERYTNALARAGFLVIHPNFRNYPPSDSGPDPFRTGYAADVLNLIAIVREQSQDPLGYLRRANAERIYLWGHSMGGGIALRVITVNPAPYLRGALLYGAMSGDENRNYEQIEIWSGGREGEFELSAPPEAIQAISPINHLDRIQTPISIHHSLDDQVVPPEWSTELCQLLEKKGKTVECFDYEGVPHTFNGPSDQLFIQRTIEFFNRY